MEVKRVGIFQVILVKLVAPPFPPQTKLNFEQNGGKLVGFLAHGHNIAGGSGGRGNELRAHQKIVVRSMVLRNNYLEGLFRTVPSSFVLQCSFLLVSKVAKEPSG